MMHWAQDHQRCSQDPDLDDISNSDEFQQALFVSAQHASLQKPDAEQMDTISKAVDPGKFKDKKKWPDWEPAFVNYLSTIPGVRGVALSYVVREHEASYHETDFGNDFTARSIACAPLNDSSFRADARKVHQLLMNFLVAESAEQWIKDLTPRVNGRRDMEALHNHYGGEGNASRGIATAEKLRESLHYKSERSLPFSTFLDRMQNMFNIFKEEGEQLTENAKVSGALLNVSNTCSSRAPSRRYMFATTLMVLPTQRQPITSPLQCPSFPNFNLHAVYPQLIPSEAVEKGSTRGTAFMREMVPYLLDITVILCHS